jgi:hypothetical protein
MRLILLSLGVAIVSRGHSNSWLGFLLLNSPVYGVVQAVSVSSEDGLSLRRRTRIDIYKLIDNKVVRIPPRSHMLLTRLLLLNIIP